MGDKRVTPYEEEGGHPRVLSQGGERGGGDALLRYLLFSGSTSTVLSNETWGLGKTEVRDNS